MTSSVLSTSCASFRLDALRIIRICGEDRLRFLQGQLTQDVMHLKPGALTPAGLCSPKGRLLATPRLAVLEDAVLMIVAADERDALVKRLKMYVLRSKVTVEPLDTLSVVALTQEAQAGELSFSRPAPSPDASSALGLTGSVRWALLPAHQATELPALKDLPAQEVAAGEPWVFAASSDAFVPQGINLECVGGVSFSKGCYTGQEVVSRVEHIGKTQRRAALARLDGDTVPTPMTEVLDAAGTPVGVVVYASASPSGVAALLQLGIALIEDAPADLTVAGSAVTLLPLPYGYERAA